MEDILITGIFADSKKAGEAVSELKQKGYTDDISVVAKDAKDREVSGAEVKEDVSDGVLTGATIGGIAGGLAGIAAGTAAITVPGIGPLLVAGPLAAFWGVTGGAAGALGGGLVGALVDAGLPENKAKDYEHRILAGEVLVAVSADAEHREEVENILASHAALETKTEHASA